jgi:hypothetical protein
MPLSSCENIWLRKLVLHQCPHVIFTFHSCLVEQVLHAMVTKTMNLHVLPHLKSITTISCSFDF